MELPAVDNGIYYSFPDPNRMSSWMRITVERPGLGPIRSRELGLNRGLLRIGVLQQPRDAAATQQVVLQRSGNGAIHDSVVLTAGGAEATVLHARDPASLYELLLNGSGRWELEVYQLATPDPAGLESKPMLVSAGRPGTYTYGFRKPLTGANLLTFEVPGLDLARKRAFARVYGPNGLLGQVALGAVGLPSTGSTVNVPDLGANGLAYVAVSSPKLFKLRLDRPGTTEPCGDPFAIGASGSQMPYVFPPGDGGVAGNHNAWVTSRKAFLQVRIRHPQGEDLDPGDVTVQFKADCVLSDAAFRDANDQLPLVEIADDGLAIQGTQAISRRGRYLAQIRARGGVQWRIAITEVDLAAGGGGGGGDDDPGDPTGGDVDPGEPTGGDASDPVVCYWLTIDAPPDVIIDEAELSEGMWQVYVCDGPRPDDQGPDYRWVPSDVDPSDDPVDRVDDPADAPPDGSDLSSVERPLPPPGAM